MHISITCLLLGAGIFLAGCGRTDKPAVDNPSSPDDSNALFRLVPSEKSHVTFNNQLTEGLNTNVLLYEYFYNGGGVAIADVNGDGWEDLYFTGNMTGNKLYLNKGNWQF